MISPHNEWYIGIFLVYAYFSSKVAHVYDRLRSYLDF